MRVFIDDKEYLDVSEAAQVASYTRDHIRRLARQGKIESVKQGILVFISRESLDSYLQEMEELGTQRFSPYRDKKN